MFNLFLVLIISVTSCAKKDDKTDTTTEAGLFFDIVYYTKAVRQINTTSWNTVQGVQRFKFTLDTDESGSSLGTGHFVVQYDAYKEPLYNAGTCSGGYEGSFTVQESTTDTTTDPNSPYNPLDPYNSGDSTPPPSSSTDTGTTDGTDETTVYYYIFNLTVEDDSFSAGCTTVAPQTSFSLRIIRYPNGDLIITNDSRSLDFYAQPELVNQ